MTLAKALIWAVPTLALLMVGLTLTPAAVWQAPATDVIYRGFDANLIYTNGGGGGRVTVSPASTELLATPNSQPIIHMVTTPLRKLVASVRVTLSRSDNAATPFRVGIWSPRTGAGYFVAFESTGLIVAETVANAGPTATASDVVGRTELGSYAIGRHYLVTFLVDRDLGLVSGSVSNDISGTTRASVNSTSYPSLFNGVRLSLSASASGGDGTSDVILDDYRLTLPHQRFWASKIDDPKAKAALISLAVAGLVLLAITIAKGLSSGMAARVSAKLREAPSALLSRIPKRKRVVLVGAGAIALYLAGNTALFPLGGHPFDMGAEKLYAYVARSYGLADLYYLPNVVSLAKVWGGTPNLESGFPYEPVIAYLFAGIGWVNSLVFAGAGVFALDSARLEYLIKATNVLFGLGDAVLVYRILRKLQVGERWSLAGSALFLFNPAVWYSMSVWGQTHVISLFFVLAVIWFAETNRPLLAWLALAAACLTRPQMLVFGLLLGVVLLKKFRWERSVVALSWTAVLTFLVLLPLTLATSPSLPVDIMLNNFQIQEAGGNDPGLTPVSQGAYSIWPLVTYVSKGASGLQREFVPSSQTLVGNLTYQRASLILTGVALLLLTVALALRKRAQFESGGYIPAVALGITSFLMLLTAIVSTHFLLALPLLLLSRRWTSSLGYLYIAIIWTVTSFVAMFGEMGAILSVQYYPQLAPAHNVVTRFFVQLYASDRFITLAVVGDICAMIWLAFLTFRPSVHQASTLAAASK